MADAPLSVRSTISDSAGGASGLAELIEHRTQLLAQAERLEKIEVAALKALRAKEIITPQKSIERAALEREYEIAEAAAQAAFDRVSDFDEAIRTYPISSKIDLRLFATLIASGSLDEAREGDHSRKLAKCILDLIA